MAARYVVRRLRLVGPGSTAATHRLSQGQQECGDGWVRRLTNSCSAADVQPGDLPLQALHLPIMRPENRNSGSFSIPLRDNGLYRDKFRSSGTGSLRSHKEQQQLHSDLPPQHLDTTTYGLSLKGKALQEALFQAWPNKVAKVEELGRVSMSLQDERSTSGNVHLKQVAEGFVWPKLGEISRPWGDHGNAVSQEEEEDDVLQASSVKKKRKKKMNKHKQRKLRRRDKK